MGKTFVIADTHFGDASIIRAIGRPFDSIEEMDNFMIEKWNSVVSKDDDIIVAGDFLALPKENKKEYVFDILSRLNFKNLELVMGNHDTEELIKIMKSFSENIDIYKYPIVKDEFWIISHHPMFVNERTVWVNVFGHVHNNPTYRDVSTRSICVSTERLDYTPIEWQKVKELVVTESRKDLEKFKKNK